MWHNVGVLINMPQRVVVMDLFIIMTAQWWMKDTWKNWYSGLTSLSWPYLLCGGWRRKPGLSGIFVTFDIFPRGHDVPVWHCVNRWDMRTVSLAFRKSCRFQRTGIGRPKKPFNSLKWTTGPCTAFCMCWRRNQWPRLSFWGLSLQCNESRQRRRGVDL